MRAVNLLPREEPKRHRQKMTGFTQIAIISPFVVGSLLGAGYLLSSSTVNDKKATLTALQDDLSKIPPVVAQPQTNAQLALQKDQRVSALSLALQSRIAWDRILREISSIVPEDVWLTTLSATSPGVASVAPPPPPAPTTTDAGSADATSATGDQTTTEAVPVAPAPVIPTAPLNIGGYTYSQDGVARLMSRLAVLPELQNVRLISSAAATVSGRTVVQFSITADVRRVASA